MSTVPFATAVPASAVALGAIPEDHDEPPINPCADDMICDLQDRLNASTGAQRGIQEQLLQQQKMMDQMAAAERGNNQLTTAVESITTAAQNATTAVAVTQN